MAANRLRHVRWIGGGSGAGKSTIAQTLATEHGLRLYNSDDALAEHVRRSNLVDHPLLHQFLAMDMDERWVNRPPSEMLATFHGFQGEAFELIVEDLLALRDKPPILCRGLAAPAPAGRTSAKQSKPSRLAHPHPRAPSRRLRRARIHVGDRREDK